MPGNVVLDSSVIAAIFFPEAVSEKAWEIAEKHDCTTVDLAYAEVANVAWKRANHSGQDTGAAKEALADCTAFISQTCQVFPAQDLIPAAYDLACTHRITLYDALFLAAALRCTSPLVTVDKKLHAAAKTSVTCELLA